MMSLENERERLTAELERVRESRDFWRERVERVQYELVRYHPMGTLAATIIDDAKAALRGETEADNE